jgi:HTH-type transcriptional regulator/antitoxin HigA
MDPKPIHTLHEHRRILKEIEGLMNAKRNTPEGDRLDVLVTLVEAWEAKHGDDITCRPWKERALGEGLD